MANSSTLPYEILIKIMGQAIEPCDVKVELDIDPRHLLSTVTSLPEITNLRLISKKFDKEVRRGIKEKYTGRLRISNYHVYDSRSDFLQHYFHLHEAGLVHQQNSFIGQTTSLEQFSRTLPQPIAWQADILKYGTRELIHTHGNFERRENWIELDTAPYPNLKLIVHNVKCDSWMWRWHPYDNIKVWAMDRFRDMIEFQCCEEWSYLLSSAMIDGIPRVFRGYYRCKDKCVIMEGSLKKRTLTVKTVVTGDRIVERSSDNLNFDVVIDDVD